jgi:hypothetical protein
LLGAVPVCELPGQFAVAGAGLAPSWSCHEKRSFGCPFQAERRIETRQFEQFLVADRMNRPKWYGRAVHGSAQLYHADECEQQGRPSGGVPAYLIAIVIV